jgi:hypothetical protein
VEALKVETDGYMEKKHVKWHRRIVVAGGRVIFYYNSKKNCQFIGNGKIFDKSNI